MTGRPSALAIASGAALALTGCVGLPVPAAPSAVPPAAPASAVRPTRDTTTPVASPSTSPPATTRPSDHPAPSGRTVTTPSGQSFERAYAEFSTTLSGKNGVAVAALGGGPAQQAGSWSTGVAWSTSKVPLAQAVMRANSDAVGSIPAAITASDNASAETLWTSLGTGEQASRKVSTVIADNGGGQVRVPAQRPRSEFSAFGQTQWSLESQAAFMAKFSCRKENAKVYSLMGQVTADQRWGLGRLPGARLKGGWGPSTGGGYLVRQMGVIETPRGKVAVAIATEPASGDFASGTAQLSKIAAWLTEHAELLPAGNC